MGDFIQNDGISRSQPISRLVSEAMNKELVDSEAARDLEKQRRSAEAARVTKGKEAEKPGPDDGGNQSGAQAQERRKRRGQERKEGGKPHGADFMGGQLFSAEG